MTQPVQSSVLSDLDINRLSSAYGSVSSWACELREEDFAVANPDYLLECIVETVEDMQILLYLTTEAAVLTYDGTGETW